MSTSNTEKGQVLCPENTSPLILSTLRVELASSYMKSANVVSCVLLTGHMESNTSHKEFAKSSQFPRDSNHSNASMC